MAIMLVHTLLVLIPASAAVLGDSVFSKTAGALISVLYQTSQVCDVCIVNDESVDEIIHGFIREFWTASDPISLVHGSSDVIGNSVERKCCLYLIVLNTHEQFDGTMSRLTAGSSWNLYAKFVFYTEWHQIVNERIVTYLRTFVTEVIFYGLPRAVLICHLTNSSMVRGFTIAPFQRTLTVKHNLQEIVEMLTTIPFQNLHQHPITASSVGFYEIPENRYVAPIQEPYTLLLTVLAKRLNGTAAWVHPTSEGFVDAIEKMFAVRKINILFRAKMKSKLVTFVPVPIITSDCFLVPEKKVESYFKLLYVPFSYPVWITLVVIVVILCLMCRLFREQFPRNVILQVLFGTSVSDHQMKRPERFTCFALAVLLFFLSECYLTLLIQLILDNEYYPHLKTLDEFLRSKVEILATPAVYHFLQINHPAYSAKTVETSLAESESIHDKFAALVFRDLGELYVRSASNIHAQTNARKFYILPETLEWNVLQHTVSRYEPLGAELQWLQVHLIESGIWSFWNSQHRERFTSRMPLFADRVLRFVNLISMWYILAYGFSVGGICFAMEWVVFCWHRRTALKKAVEIWAVTEIYAHIIR